MDDSCPSNPTVQLRAGGAHACEVKQKGAVACWGAGSDGQLGDGAAEAHSAPTPIPRDVLDEVTDVALGGRHTCALRRDATVWCWGANESGQVGDGTFVARSRPVPVRDASGAPLGEVTRLVAGGAFTCAAQKTGTVSCWGRNVDGELGQETKARTPSPVPTPVAELGDVTALAARDRHACALTGAGAVWCWGVNTQGELGDGTQVSRAQPARVLFSSDDSQVPIVGLAAGAAHTCALGQRRLWCWGTNLLGEVGDGSEQAQLSPVVVPLREPTQVAAAGHHTCALEADGTVWCWGANQAGQLGEGTTSNFGVPVPVTGLDDVEELALGDAFSCSRQRDGTVRCWGDDRAGQLGIGAQIQRATPGAVGVPAVVANSVALSAGGAHTCALRRNAASPTNATICWGDNQAGQVGDGTRIDRSSPVTLKVSIPAVQVAGGALHTCLRDTSGGIWCWGRNGSGQTGSAALIDVSVPTRVAGLGVGGLGESIEVVVGRDHSCALLTDGAVWCWGANTDGQLGDGGSGGHSLPAPVAGVENVVDLASGGAHSCAVHLGGTVSCWGRGLEGQLGDGLNTSAVAPITVPDLRDVVALVAGGNHTCARLADLTVRCWGAGRRGQLGWGVAQDHGAPAPVMGLSSVVELAAGENHTCARVAPDGVAGTAGEVFCWGDNRASQLGSDVGQLALIPGPMAVTGSAAAITAGGQHTCALKADGTIVCWGANSAGQLGDGTPLQLPTPQSVSTPCP